jgi:hypothetical protein
MGTFSHLDAIQGRIRRETERRDNATNANERAYREREIAAAKREEAAEYAFLGIVPVTIADISDDDLLRELDE